MHTLHSQHFFRRERPFVWLFGALITMLAVPTFAQDLESVSNQKPIGLGGAITLSGADYQANGIPYRREPFSWTISGSPTLSFYGVQMPFSFILSEQERSFRQPFDQFAVSPQYKWMTLHLGYRSMMFSHYSLAGVTFLGAGFEASPGVIRLSGMYGRLQRPVEEDTTNQSVQPAYQRMGYAAKLGFGSDQNHFDFIFFHAKDDSLSITHPITLSQVYPQENSVLGVSTQFTIIDPLTFTMDAGGSALTRDLRASSIDSNKLPSFVSSLMDVKSSTSVSIAGETALALKLSHFAARLQYQRIEPDYTSLGAYYFNTDIENYTFAPGFDVFDGKVRVSGSIGLQHDNILQNKLAQTSRLIGSGSISWNPSQAFGLDANYTNYSTDQAGGLKPINDSIRVRNVSKSASFAPRYVMAGADANQVFSLVSSLQQYTDLNSYTNQLSNSNSATAALSYTKAFIKETKSIGGSLLFALTQTSQVTTRIFGGSVNGSTGMLENKLTLAGSIGYTEDLLSSNDTLSKLSSSAGTIMENINFTWQVGTDDNLSFTIYATENTSSQFLPRPYQEFTATMSYTRSFSF